MGNVLQKQLYPGIHVPNAKRKLEDQGFVIENISATLSVPKTQKTRDAIVVFFHGNAEDVSQTAHIYQRLRGEITVGFEYPGYGWRVSEHPSEQGLLNDVIEQVNIIQHISGNRDIIVVGRSLGSFAALNLISALDPKRCKGLVFISPMLTMCATKVPPPLHHAFRFLDYANNEQLARKLNPSINVYLAHGKNDTLVPLGNAEALWNALPLPCRHTFVPIDYAGHDHMDHHTILWTTLHAFLDDVLKD